MPSHLDQAGEATQAHAFAQQTRVRFELVRRRVVVVVVDRYGEHFCNGYLVVNDASDAFWRARVVGQERSDEAGV